MKSAKSTKTVRITNDDLYRVLAGRELQVSTSEPGEYVQLRMYTTEELLAEHARISAEVDMEPNMNRAQAENLTRQHDLYKILEEAQKAQKSPFDKLFKNN